MSDELDRTRILDINLFYAVNKFLERECMEVYLGVCGLRVDAYVGSGMNSFQIIQNSPFNKYLAYD